MQRMQQIGTLSVMSPSS